MLISASRENNRRDVAVGLGNCGRRYPLHHDADLSVTAVDAVVCSCGDESAALRTQSKSVVVDGARGVGAQLEDGS